jgi:hypothetical protein
MHKAIGVALSSVLLATSVMGTSASAASHFDRQDRYIRSYCDRHPGDPTCHDWRYHHRRWDESRYHDWYGHHRREFGPGDAAAALFGFAAGAITGAISGSVNGAEMTAHQARCDAHYQTYDWRTDTYMGFDHERHVCRL